MAADTEAPARIDLSDDANVAYWRERFGVTLEQLDEAVGAVGDRPDRVQEHLLNQGGSAGAS
jgi:hypothetical protein